MRSENPLKILKKYFVQKEYLGLLLSSLLAMMILNSLNLTIPKISSTIIEEFRNNLSVPTTYYFYIIGLLLITSTASFLQNYLFSLAGEKIGTDLRNRLMRKVLKQDYNYLVKEKPSKILTVILSDVNNVKSSFFQALGAILTSVILIVGSAIMMFSLNARIATYIVLTVPAIIGILFLILRKRFGIFKKIQQIRDSLNKVINENIKASMLVRVFVAEKTEMKKFSTKNSRSRILGIEITKLFSIAIPAVSAISLLASLIIIQIGGQEAIAGRLLIGEISAFNLYVMIFTMPLIVVSFMSTLLGQAFASIKRIGDVLNRKSDFVNGKEDISSIENIVIKDVAFVDDGLSILQGINFKINQGEKIGIMGLTGSGKSLFLSLLVRATSPTSGEILVNGKDIRQYKINEMRKTIGFCFQENFLVNATIYENIKFGRDIQSREIYKVAKVAEVEEFVKKAKRGYRTKAGERGSSLSGGQKQRIMIARALAGKPSLLILDDVTSRLDTNTEVKIFKNIKRTYPSLSMILVSQKISSLKDCNRIYIFDKGETKESGTHNQLLKTSTLYKEIELVQSNYDE